jgi:hypothetical protein
VRQESRPGTVPSLPASLRRRLENQQVPLQSGSGPSFTIHVDSSAAQPRPAWGSASRRGLFPLGNVGRLEHFCSTPADHPLRIRFYIDAAATPRPRPFQPPVLSVIADFTASGGSSRRIANVTDPAPRYRGAGSPLAPAFGELFAADSSQSGAINVQARISDPDTTTTLIYADTVACELVPCNLREGGSHGHSPDRPTRVQGRTGRSVAP